MPAQAHSTEANSCREGRRQRLRRSVAGRWLVPVAAIMLVMSIAGGTTRALARPLGASGPHQQAVSVATVTDPCGHSGAIPAITHVVLILFENRSDNDILNHTSAPNVQALARECGFASWYHAASHPSLPNYLALAGGEQPAVGDCNPRGALIERCPTPPVPYGVPDLFSSVCTASCATPTGSCSQPAAPSYVSCLEGMPFACDQNDYNQTTSQPFINYSVHHNPQLFFGNVGVDSLGAAQPACPAYDLPLAKTAVPGGDVATITSLPSLLLLTADDYDNMHSGGVAAGDRWLASAVNALEATPDYQSGSTVIIFTFDEGDKSVNHSTPVGRDGNCYDNTADDSSPGVYTSTSGFAQSCLVPLIVMNYFLSGARGIGGSSGPVTTFLNHYDTLYTMLSLLGADTSTYAAFAPGGVDGYTDSINAQPSSAHPIDYACQAYFAITTGC